MVVGRGDLLNTDDVDTITVVTWNVLGRDDPDPAALADHLREIEADAVLLQEAGRRLAGRVRKALAWDHGHWWFKHWPMVGPAEGCAILSRRPLSEAKSVTLERAVPVHHWRRIAGACTVSTRQGPLRLVATHLGADIEPTQRVRQASRLVEFLGAARSATVLGGDLNAEPTSLELATFASTGLVDSHEVPDGGPPARSNWSPGPRDSPPDQRLDYVLVGENVRVHRTFIPGPDDPSLQLLAGLSDHVPVAATVSRIP